MVTAVWRSIGQGVGKFGRRVSDPFLEDMGLVLIRKGMSSLSGRCGRPSSSTVPWTWFHTWSVTVPLFRIAQECGHSGEGQNRLGGWRQERSKLVQGGHCIEPGVMNGGSRPVDDESTFDDFYRLYDGLYLRLCINIKYLEWVMGHRFWSCQSIFDSIAPFLHE